MIVCRTAPSTSFPPIPKRSCAIGWRKSHSTPRCRPPCSSRATQRRRSFSCSHLSPRCSLACMKQIRIQRQQDVGGPSVAPTSPPPTVPSPASSSGAADGERTPTAGAGGRRPSHNDSGVDIYSPPTTDGVAATSVVPVNQGTPFGPHSFLNPS